MCKLETYKPEQIDEMSLSRQHLFLLVMLMLCPLSHDVDIMIISICYCLV